MPSFLYLSSCSSCKRIMETLSLPKSVTLVDLKNYPLTAELLTHLYKATGSYEALINKRAQLFKQLGIDTKNLNEDQCKSLLLEHYTFVKRPILIDGAQVFVGNSPSVVLAAKKWLDEQ